MPFPTLISAGFTDAEDSQFFQDNPVDASIKFETQGGLTITRKRYTRNPPRVITTGFSMITQANYTLLLNLWEAQGGGSWSFAYTHPTTGENLTVRFDKEWKAEYKGAGTTFLWTISEITLRTL
jgi:hypothetical protein